MLNPLFPITWLTFPGVIVKEFALALFCFLYGKKIYAIKYFRFTPWLGETYAYVRYERPNSPATELMILLAPFIVNTAVGGIIASPGVIPIVLFHAVDPLNLFLVWLGFSIASHAFPTCKSSTKILDLARSSEIPLFTRFLAAPIVAFVCLGAAVSGLFLDLAYGACVVGFTPVFFFRMISGFLRG